MPRRIRRSFRRANRSKTRRDARRVGLGSTKSFFTEPQGGAGRDWRKFQPVRPSGRVTDQKPGIKYTGRACHKVLPNPCASKLVFIKKSEAKALGTQPGPNLLYCMGEAKPGPLIPVKNAREATELGKKFCACTRESGSTKSCATQAFNGYKMKRRTRR